MPAENHGISGPRQQSPPIAPAWPPPSSPQPTSKPLSSLKLTTFHPFHLYHQVSLARGALQTQIHPSRPIADITSTTLSLGPSLCSQGLVRIPIDSVSPSRYPLPWLVPTTLHTRALLVSCAELAMAWRLYRMLVIRLSLLLPSCPVGSLSLL